MTARPSKVRRVESTHRMKFQPKPSQEASSPLVIGVATTDSPNSGFGHGVKKLVIRNSKARDTSANDEYIQKSHTKLLRAIRSILSPDPRDQPYSLQELYSLCENVMNYNPSSCKTLYDHLRVEIEKRAMTLRNSVTQISLEGVQWAAHLEQEWKVYIEHMLMIRSVFLHLDRTFILEQSSLMPIRDLSTDIFCRIVLQAPEIASRLTSSLNLIINDDREGFTFSFSLLKSILSLLSGVGEQEYLSIFIKPFLSETETYYKHEGDKLIQEMPPAKYIQHCATRLDAEESRLDTTLISTTSSSTVKKQLITTVQDNLFTNHVREILDNGLPSLIESQDYTTLRILLMLSNRTNSLSIFCEGFKSYIEKTGKALVQDPTQDSQMISTLLAYKEKIYAILKNAFDNNTTLVNTTVKAFRDFINTRQNKPAELMAKYIDTRMRTGIKGMTMEEWESEFKELMVFLGWAQGKDMFEAFYKRDFAKRLLLNRSASSDAEKTMILKLKEECGAQFTGSLQTMARDIDLSADIMRSFKNMPNEVSSSQQKEQSFDLSVAVLTQGNWPNYEPVQVALPPNMVRALENFKVFYDGKFGGRKLQWQHSLDQCTLKADFPKGKKELSVSLFQALILLLFNGLEDDHQLEFSEIVQLTKLSDEEASRTLQSLACGKVRVLTKDPKGRDVNPGDKFAVNLQFKNEFFKLKINAIQIKETPQEQKTTTERVLIDRQSHLQLIIVRILKSRKTISHQELVIEIISALKERFKVETPEIKKAIDSLIERDFIQRKQEARGVYEYVA